MSPPREVILRHSLPLPQNQEFVVPHFVRASFLQLQPHGWKSSGKASSSVHSSHTSYWPLCSGGCLSQEAMWQLQGITVNFKRNRKGFVPEECTSLHDCFTNTSSDSLEKGSYTTYLIRLQSHRDLMPQILPELKLTQTCWHTAGGFWGQRTGTGLLSFSCIYL